MEGNRFWIIAFPSNESSLSNLAEVSQARSLSTNSEFRVPSLSVGTLDKLMTLSDVLGKTDEKVESIVRKIAKQYEETIEQNRGDGQRKAKSAPTTLLVDNQSASSYIRKFDWEKARFPVKSSLEDLTNTISDLCDGYSEDLRKHAGRYQEVKTTLNAIERKETGSLVLRSLNGIVKKEHVVSGEYIKTLIVVVPREKEQDFLESYEHLEDNIPPEDLPQPMSKHGTICRIIVPGSALEVFRDQEFVLFRVVAFKNGVERYKKAAREHRFTCRDFVYDASEHQKSIEKTQKLEKEREFLWRHLVKWCSTTYSEVFKAWVHLKAIRTFVEAVLRFGLPVSFTAATLEVKSPAESKLRSSLADLFSGLAGAHHSSVKDDVDYSGVAADFYPYVYLKIDA